MVLNSKIKIKTFNSNCFMVRFLMAYVIIVLGVDKNDLP